MRCCRRFRSAIVSHTLHVIGWLFVGLSLAGSVYTLMAASIAGRFRAQPSPRPLETPPVTLLKPLHFDGPGLEQDLETFLVQDYPAPIQIVFGVQDPSDPAIAIVDHLKTRYPNVDIDLVIDQRRYGSNAKVCNLINMAEHAKHDVLVLSDADIAVPHDYLQRVVGALIEPGVGAVTCPYTGNPGANAWSTLAAMGTSYEFLSNLLFGTWWGLADACLGSTIALRRTMLNDIGGFDAFADYLADDFEIGRAVRHRGLKTVLLPMAVSHRCTEQSLYDLFSHELRWSRTVRVVRPWSHLGTIVTFPVALALIGLGFAGLHVAPVLVLCLALLARLTLKSSVDKAFGAAAGPHWLLPLRDTISFLVFLASFLGQKVAWRGTRFRVGPSGAMSQH
jgi:ceramide glucosyltransferase